MTGETRVGHHLADETDVYAGRGPGGRTMAATAPGRRGWLGNPYVVEDHGREKSIELFRRDFERRLADDETFREAVRDLSGEALGCWCQRLDEDGPPCHAEVVAEWADRLDADGDGAEAELGVA